ncbi:MAG: DedA family protein [Halobacteriovoraceae bacterium]|nr:DedA family protein [Halobacteriovoraceae bacterium]
MTFIQSNVATAPYIIFGLLFLAGFNIPVSEDMMCFVAAIMAAKNPQYLWPLFIAIYAGAYVSDVICFFLGRVFGEKLLKIKFFSSMVPPDRVKKIHSFYEKYGIITLILGRFIPFGIRNGLFLTAGLGKMNIAKFCLSDLTAVTISVCTYFTIYYHFGDTVLDTIKKSNYIIFSVAIVVVIYFLIKNRSKKRAQVGP